MADPDLKKAAFCKRDTGPFIWFILISFIVNGIGAVGGWWIKLPAPEEEKVIPADLVDANDVEKLGDPNAPEEASPPEPEPTPPPEPEPTPPPLDKLPEFEIPEPTPTPTPTPSPVRTPKPKPQPTIKPQRTPQPATPASGLVKGSPTGAPNGTGNGGPRSGLWLRSPKPPYPPQAQQLHITGECKVKITVSNGTITDVTSISGPPMLGSAAVRWIKGNWKGAPTTNGTFTLPVSFVLQ